MEIDAVGTFTMSRAAFQALKEAKSSVIINISATLHYGATWYQVGFRNGSLHSRQVIVRRGKNILLHTFSMDS
jgi:NAD(P)-dependent dehydrogenase (short-subunit alcohol dehydrogenase family)